MAIVNNLKTTNLTATDKIQSNVVKANTFEGIPIASHSKLGLVKINNDTICINEDGYLSISDELLKKYDDSEVLRHIHNSSIHLSESQINRIAEAYGHVSDNYVHISSEDRNKLDKVLTHLSNENIHVNESEKRSIQNITSHISDDTRHITGQITIDLQRANDHIINTSIHLKDSDINILSNSKNHMTNVDLHLTESDKISISNANQHISKTNIHLSEADKNSIASINSHIVNDNLHLKSGERDKITNSENHIKDSSIHINSIEKANLGNFQNLVDNLNEHIADMDMHLRYPDVRELRDGVADNAREIATLKGADIDIRNNINDLSNNKLDKGNHTANRILITGSDGVVTYHKTISPDDLSSSSDISSLTQLINGHTSNNNLHVTSIIKDNISTAYTHSQSSHLALGETSSTAYRGDRGKIAYDHSQSTHLSLGETSTTAYRGDRGKIAYDHSQVSHAPSNAQANVQSDWNATSGDAFIKNKPTILSLGETSTTAYRGDRGKVAYNHSQSAHAPSNAQANVQSDWNATSGDAYIKNKPTIPTIPSSLPANGGNADTVGGYRITVSQTQPSGARDGDIWISW